MWTRLVLARTCLVVGRGSRSHFCQDHHSASAAHGKTSGTCGKGRFCPSDVRKDVSAVLKVPFCQSGARKDVSAVLKVPFCPSGVRKDVSAVLKVPFCPSDVTKEPMTRQKSSAERAALSSPAQRLICSSRRSYIPAALPLSPNVTSATPSAVSIYEYYVINAASASVPNLSDLLRFATSRNLTC